LGGGLPGAGSAQRVARIVSASPAAWIVATDMWKDGEIYRASVDLYDAHNPEPQTSFAVDSGGTAALVDLISTAIRKRLVPDDPGSGRNDPRAEQLASSSDKARILEFEARQAMRALQYQRAIDLLEEALEIDPRFVLARARLARTLHAAGYGTRARDNAVLALQLVEGPLADVPQQTGTEVRATHARAHDRLDEEEKYRRELAEQEPDDPAVLIGLAQLLRDRGGKAEEALALIHRALELDRRDPRAHLEHASILAQLSRHDDASAALAMAESLFEELDSGQGPSEVALRRGGLASRRRDFAEAARHYEQATEGFRDAGLTALEARAELAWGDAELAQGHLDAAKSHYDASLTEARKAGLHRIVIRALGGLGGQLYAAGSLESAEQYLRAASREAREIDNPRLLSTPVVNLASLLLYTGRVSEGRGLAEEALNLARDRQHRGAETHAVLLLADSDFLEGRLRSAVASVRELVSFQRSAVGSIANVGWSLTSLAEILDALGQTREATLAIDEAISSHRERDERIDLGYALVQRALLRGQLALWDEAQEDLREAAEIAQDAVGLLSDLVPRVALAQARLSFMKGDVNEADRHVRRALELGGRSRAVRLAAPLLISSCEIAHQLGDKQRATRACRAALAKPAVFASDLARARVAMARAMLDAGDSVSAAREARRALEDAERMELPLTSAAAAAVLASLDSPPLNLSQDQVRQRGRAAFEKYIAGAPADRRQDVLQRPDLAELVEILEVPRDSADLLVEATG
ncbi:MAG: hypothetical protein JSV80_07250, partial [Acidobacteriota bacterium]